MTELSEDYKLENEQTVDGANSLNTLIDEFNGIIKAWYNIY